MISTAGDPKLNYTGNGLELSFVVNFEWWFHTDVVVSLTNASGVDVAVTEGGAGTYDYTLYSTYSAGLGRYTNGYIKFNTAPPSGYGIAITRSTLDTQSLDLNAGSGIPPDDVERAFDRAVMRHTELAELISRAPVRHPVLDTYTASMTFAQSAKVTGLPTPTSASDAATKSYVDGLIAGITSGLGAITGLPTANSIAALKALNTATVTTCFVLGYSAVMDGGGGIYEYDSGSAATDNGGTVIQPNAGAGRWRLKHDGFVTAKQFGALGGDADGEAATNNTALQAWLTAAVADAFVAVLTKGIYRTSVRLDITGKCNVQGTGMDAVLKSHSTGTHIILYVHDTGANNQIDGVFLSTFMIDGNTRGQLDAGLLQINDAWVHGKGLRVRNGTRVSGASGVNGIGLAHIGGGTGTGTTGYFEDCWVDTTSKSSWDCASLANNITLVRCHGLTATGSGSPPGFQFNGANNIKVIACYANACQGAGFACTDGNGTETHSISFQFCTADGNGTGATDGNGWTCSAVGPGVNNLEFVGCISRNNGNAGLGGHGVYLYTVLGARFEGGLFTRNYTDGLRIEASKRIVVVGGEYSDNNRKGVSWGNGIQCFGACDGVAIHGITSKGALGGTQSYGIGFGSGSTIDNADIHSNTLDGNVTGYFNGDGALSSGTVEINIAYATTDAAAHTAQYLTLADDRACTIEAKVTAVLKTTGASRASFWKEALLYRDGGGVTRDGALLSVRADKNTPAYGGVDLDGSANLMRLQLTGIVGNVNWKARIRYDVASSA